MIWSDETCEAVEDAFGALLSGEATREEIRRANRHLETCATCRAEFAGLASFRGKVREQYGVAAPRSRRIAASVAGLALAASLLVGLAVTHLPGQWTTNPSSLTPVTVAAATPTADETTDVDEVWIDLLSDEEIEDLMIAAYEP